MTTATIRRVILGVIAVGVLVAGWQWWQSRPSPLPPGIVYGNGRIEADEVDIATKYPGRVQEILAAEGDLVAAGQVLARMDTAEVKAEIERAKAELAQAEAAVREAAAEIVERKSGLSFAEQELARALPLVRKGSLAQRVGEQRQSDRDTAGAAVKAAQAHLVTRERSVDAARAAVKQIQTQIDDATLQTPVRGRVLYRLAEPGEVLAAGGKVLTVLDLVSVYMTIFLPTAQAGKVDVGADAHIVLDALPEIALPATVSFVAPKAQFTPREVETRTEREKLMFRIKVKIDPELLKAHAERVKTGLPGVAYVRLDPNTPWPESLQVPERLTVRND